MHEEAKQLYDSGMSLADIAAKLKKKPSAVRMWKKRESWGTAATSQNVTQINNVTEEAIQSVISNTSLTAKQQLFCLLYSRSFNATKSYQKAYECDYQTAWASGPRLLANVSIRDEIMKLKEQRYSQELLKPSDIFQKYMDIAFADMTHYVNWIARDIETDDGIETVTNMTFVPSDEIDGTLITEVKSSRHGDTLKLADRMKALEWLTEHMNMATEEQKAKIDQIKASTKAIGDPAAKGKVHIHVDF